MREIIILVFILFVALSCSKKSIEKRNSDTIDTPTVEVLSDSTSINAPKKILKIPFFKDYELTGIVNDSIHIYQGGDCSGNIQSLSFSELTIAIDSLFCGDYGFTYTEYVSRDKEHQAIHQVYSTYYGPKYILTETIYDLRHSIVDIYSRTDTVSYGVSKTSKNFYKTVNTNKDSIINYWKNEQEKTWLYVYDEEF